MASKVGATTAGHDTIPGMGFRSRLARLTVRLDRDGPLAPSEVARDLYAATTIPDALAVRLCEGFPRLEFVDEGVRLARPFWRRGRHVLLDLETTGLHPEHGAEIIEVAAWRIEAGEVVDRFVTLVRPRGRIPARITEITGIDAAMVARAQPWSEVGPRLRRWLGEDPWIAHNARFDAHFLHAGFRAVGCTAPRPPVCSLRWARGVGLRGWDDRYRLASLAARFGLAHQPIHRAEPDVAALHELVAILGLYTPPPYASWEAIRAWRPSSEMDQPAVRCDQVASGGAVR